MYCNEWVDIMKKELERIHIPLTNECHLRCSFCLNSKKEQTNIYKLSPTSIMKYLIFAKEYNCYEIEFGMLVGEPFLYPVDEWKKILTFAKLIKLKTISFFTSGIVYKEDLLLFLNGISSEDFQIDIKISLYADTQDDFIKRCRPKDLNDIESFFNIEKNINFINNLKNKFFTISVENRTEKTNNNSLSKLITSNQREYDFKWTTKTSKFEVHLPERQGKCYWIDKDLGIDKDSNLIACAWLDKNSTLNLGNIFTTSVEDLRKNHQNLIEKQDKNIFTGCCVHCNGYSPREDSKKQN